MFPHNVGTVGYRTTSRPASQLVPRRHVNPPSLAVPDSRVRMAAADGPEFLHILEDSAIMERCGNSCCQTRLLPQQREMNTERAIKMYIIIKYEDHKYSSVMRARASLALCQRPVEALCISLS
jgi:hypothetical protein